MAGFDDGISPNGSINAPGAPGGGAAIAGEPMFQDGGEFYGGQLPEQPRFSPVPAPQPQQQPLPPFGQAQPQAQPAQPRPFPGAAPQFTSQNQPTHAPGPQPFGQQHSQFGQQPVTHSFRDHLRAAGAGQLADIADDRQLASELVRQRQQLEQFSRALPQLQQLAQYGQEYLRTRFAQQSNQQPGQQPAQPNSLVGMAPAQAGASPPAPAANRWSPPEYDPAWLTMVTRDANGNLVPKPYVDPTIPARIQRYADWAQQQQQQLLTDPRKFLFEQVGLKDDFQKMAQEAAREIVQRELTQQSDQQAVQRIFAENERWMVARDANGQPIVDAFGNQQLTREGQLINHFINVASQQYGIQGWQARWAFASNALMNQLNHEARQQQMQAAAQQGYPQQQFQPQQHPGFGQMQPAQPQLSPAEQQKQGFVARAMQQAQQALPPSNPSFTPASPFETGPGTSVNNHALVARMMAEEALARGIQL